MQQQLDIFPPSEARDPRLRRLYEYWLGKARGRLFPARADLDPVDFPYILGYVTLVDITAQRPGKPRRYRFRLDGSHLTAISGIDYTSRYLDELPWPDYVAFITWSYDRVVESRAPLGYRRQGDIDKRSFDEETIILPLGADGETVDKLMVAVIPGDFEPGDEAIVV